MRRTGFMRRWALLSLLGAGAGLQAQDAVRAEFCPPFDFPLLLSANFGELRPNHFHNGLDIKTQGVEGKPVRSVADGYVSRILVLHGGYGQAVFVTHPNGYTSVYGHVKRFASRIQQFVRDYQYRNETFVCDVRPAEGAFPVKAGEVIALSGNEGASAGPHLHLELRRNDNGDYVDPMPFFRKYLKDTKPPVATLVGLYPVPGKGVVNGSSGKRLVTVGNLRQPLAAWGEIYAGISAKDYMNGTSNFYGVHSVTLYVDGKEIFRSRTDEVSADENRMINGFTDYDELMRTRRLIMRSCILPGNSLRLLRAGEERGVVSIAEERDYRFEYVLEDNFSNRSVYRFTVRGKKQDIPVDEPCGEELKLYWNRTNVVQKPGMELVVPKGMLYDHAWLKAQVYGDSADVSLHYVLDMGNTPLHSFCPLAIGVARLPVADTTKYHVVQKVGRWQTSVGGTFDRGWMKTRVRTLGTFFVAVDTVAPSVVPVGRNRWRTTRDVRFRVKDAGSGIRSYKVYIDGRFVLFGLKKGVLVIQDPERIRRGTPHRVEVVVTDACGNEARRRYDF